MTKPAPSRGVSIYARVTSTFKGRIRRRWPDQLVRKAWIRVGSGGKEFWVGKTNWDSFPGCLWLVTWSEASYLSFFIYSFLIHKMRVKKMLLFSWLVVSDSFETSRTVALQAPLSMGLSRQEYYSGLPFPSPGDLPDPGIDPTSSALQGGFFLPLSHMGSPNKTLSWHKQCK